MQFLVSNLKLSMVRIKLLLFFLTISFVSTTANTVISGLIENPTWAQTVNGKENTPVYVKYYDEFNQPVEKKARVSVRGEFEMDIDLKEAVNSRISYGGTHFNAYLAPGYTLNLYFDAINVTGTLEWQGAAGMSNKIVNEYKDQYEYEVADKYNADDLFARKESHLEYFVGSGELSRSIKELVMAEEKYALAISLLDQAYDRNEKRDVFAKYNTSNDFAIMSDKYRRYVERYVKFMWGEKYLGKVVDVPKPIGMYDVAKTNLYGKTLDWYATKQIKKVIQVAGGNIDPIIQEYYGVCNNDDYEKRIAANFGTMTRYKSASTPSNAKLNDLTGTDMSFFDIVSQYSGKVVYVDFWASWCTPCISEMKHSKQLNKDYRNSNVVTLYLSTDAGENVWKSSINKHNLSGEHYLLNEKIKREIESSFGVVTLPHYMIIDKYGSIVDVRAKAPSNPELREDLNFYINY